MTPPQQSVEKNPDNNRTKVLVRHLSGSDSWKNYTEDAEVFVQQFPKVELHVHLDGAFDPDVLWQYLQTHQPDSLHNLPKSTVLPWEAADSPKCNLPVQELVRNCRSSQDYHQLCTCRGYRSLKQMLTCFEIFLPTVRRNLVLLEKMAFDFCQRQWQQHTVYTEVRYSPFLLAEGYDKSSTLSISGQDVFDSVTRGLRKGCQQFGITINQILCCITWRPDWAEPTLELVQKHRGDYPCATVGIDIASGEEHFDKDTFPHLHQPHYDVLQKAQTANVKITLHAGEVPSVKGLSNLKRAVHEYGASRIGHGYRIADSPEIMAEMKERGVHFEICPTSSVETGGWMWDDPTAYMDGDDSSPKQNAEEGKKKQKDWKKHPCRTMQTHGLGLSLNSDDPAVFHTSLAWQYRTSLVKMGMSRFELVKSNLDAIDAAFCEDEVKQTLKEQVLLYAQQTGVIDEQGQPLPATEDPMESSVHSNDSGSLGKALNHRHLRAYRHSVSENFKDRVYLETNVSALTGGSENQSSASSGTNDNDEEVMNFYS